MSGPTALGTIAHYNLLERLEPSGPGELFRARDTRLGRTVTVRWLPQGFSVPGLTQDQLIERARGLATLSHPNITTLFDAGLYDGRAFLVFEYLKGQSLRAEMAGRPINVRRAVEVAIQITNAVADAHDDGFEWLFIDTPAGVSELPGTAASLADLVLVPCTPSRLDMARWPRP